jgi:hypothetical protein
MANFPTVSRSPRISGYEEGVSNDTTIRTRSEAGYVKTRPRSTRFPDKWKATYPALTTAEKDSIRVFEKTTVKLGADAFVWTHPVDGAKTVRFSELVKYTPVSKSSLWDVTISVEEV